MVPASATLCSVGTDLPRWTTNSSPPPEAADAGGCERSQRLRSPATPLDTPAAAAVAADEDAAAAAVAAVSAARLERTQRNQ